jgi:hypothetical protein
LGYRDIGHFEAVIKCERSNAGDPVGNCDAGKAGAEFERSTAYVRDAFADGHIGQTGAKREG